MATKKRSAAAAAAAKVAGAPTPAMPPSGLWTRDMMREAVVALGGFPHLNAFDEAACVRHVAHWTRVIQVVAAGRLDADALPWATVLIEAGVEWLEEHPQFIPVNGEAWAVDDVEAVAIWFGAVAEAPPRPASGARGHAFVRVVNAGLVMPEAVDLATVLAEQIAGWLQGMPEARP